MVVRCTASTTAGSPCSAQPVRPDGYCYWHSPALAAERDAARRRGGSARSNQARAKKQIPEAMSVEDLAGWLSLLFTSVMAGRIEPKIGTACAAIARTMDELRKTTELERRLEELERRANVANDRWRA